MELQQYQVSAFSPHPFGGNPAAVVPLEAWLSKALMLSIAAENNLSETAFFVEEGGRYGLRWFTPTVEVELCGHATLATAHVLFDELGVALDTLRFDTRSGELRVTRHGDGVQLDLPVHPVEEANADPAIVQALGLAPVAAYDAPSHVYRIDT